MKSKKIVIPLRPSRRRRKFFKKQAIGIAKTQDELFVKKQLAAMNLPELLRKEWQGMAKKYDEMNAVLMLGSIVNRCAIHSMDLPESKKRIAKMLLGGHLIFMAALYRPVPKKSVLSHYNYLVKYAQGIMRTTANLSKEGIELLGVMVGDGKKAIENIRKFPTEEVAVDPNAIAYSPQKIYSLLIAELIGEKNLMLLNAAKKEANRVVSAIKAGETQ